MSASDLNAPDSIVSDGQEASARKDALPPTERLKISEIFYSLQGEALTSGAPTVFVRLTGCPLRCQYCDTAYAFHGGQWLSFDQILAAVRQHGARYVCVTGGEPLAQKNCASLMVRLCDAGFEVSVETSGAYDISGLDTRIVRVMDLKTPGSGEESRNRWENIAHLRQSDQVKFVICSRDDYLWAKGIVKEYELKHKATVLFSPSFEQQDPTELANWVLKDRLPVRLQLQLHKLLWGDKPGV
ncbi:MAG: 7-carboxy-7-deazaguanine synthase QueE [Gammaproteobacteria bacterium]|nr:7-carboxy-7-deazaguanine synthase QueE [Gammaproteobacteria bacterium]